MLTCVVDRSVWCTFWICNIPSWNLGPHWSGKVNMNSDILAQQHVNINKYSPKRWRRYCSDMMMVWRYSILQIRRGNVTLFLFWISYNTTDYKTLWNRDQTASTTYCLAQILIMLESLLFKGKVRGQVYKYSRYGSLVDVYHDPTNPNKRRITWWLFQIVKFSNIHDWRKLKFAVNKQQICPSHILCMEIWLKS